MNKELSHITGYNKELSHITSYSRKKDFPMPLNNIRTVIRRSHSHLASPTSNNHSRVGNHTVTNQSKHKIITHRMLDMVQDNSNIANVSHRLLSRSQSPLYNPIKNLLTSNMGLKAS